MYLESLKRLMLVCRVSIFLSVLWCFAYVTVLNVKKIPCVLTSDTCTVMSRIMEVNQLIKN